MGFRYQVKVKTYKKKHAAAAYRVRRKVGRIDVLCAQLDRTVQQAEKCGKLTQIRKALLLRAESLRDLILNLEEDAQTVLAYLKAPLIVDRSNN